MLPDSNRQLLQFPAGRLVHLVGAKGTGVCALAEILVARGARVSGSDTNEEFYTDRILRQLGIPVEPFETAKLASNTDFVIRSAAYDDNNPIVLEAMNRGLPVLDYPVALGLLSETCDASAIAGVHGKTTTTAIAGTILKHLNSPATVLVGSAVSSFGDRSTWQGGEDFLVAETCEYRRHFLHFSPKRIVLTNVESDHQDYYPDYESIRNAFVEFICQLPSGGSLIYCFDDPGAREIAGIVMKKKALVKLIPYGETAKGPWSLTVLPPVSGCNRFKLSAFPVEFSLSIPGRHNALNAAAALCLVHSMLSELDASSIEHALKAIAEFRGSRRRSEIIGTARGILIMDDYAHHPTAIRATLQGLKEFYPDRRLAVDFMPHTYSRTAALMNEFADSFMDADLLGLHPIYASAREVFTTEVSGRELAEKTAYRRPGKTTVFHENFDAALSWWKKNLRDGDLFLTLGAGNNFILGQKLFGDLTK